MKKKGYGERTEMTVNEGVMLRIKQLLQERDMTQYQLEKKSGILHGSMNSIVKNRNQTVTLTTIYLLAKGFEMSVTEFLDADCLRAENLAMTGK